MVMLHVILSEAAAGIVLNDGDMKQQPSKGRMLQHTEHGGQLSLLYMTIQNCRTTRLHAWQCLAALECQQVLVENERSLMGDAELCTSGNAGSDSSCSVTGSASRSKAGMLTIASIASSL